MGTYVDTEALDIIDHQRYKTLLLVQLEKYEKSRTGIISYLFRDKDLIQKKKALVNELKKSIIGLFASGLSLEVVRSVEIKIKEAITENARISSEAQKFHYNLSENRPLIYKSTDDCWFGERDVREGEEANQSKLAYILHNSLDNIEAYKKKMAPK